MFERALDPSRIATTSRRASASRTRPAPRWVIRGAYGVFYSHTVRQGREGLLGFNPPYLVDNLLQTGVTGAAAVASAAPFRLVNGYPSGLLDPNVAGADGGAPRAGCEPAHAVHPAVQPRHPVRADDRPAARPCLRRQQGHEAERVPQPESARRSSPTRTASQSAGPRPYPAFGDIQWMENRVDASYNSLQARLEKRFSHGLSALVSYTWGKALTEAPDHISTSGGGAGFDTGTFREPQDGNNLQAERGLAEFDVKHRFVASYIWELPFGRGRHFGNDWSTMTERAARRLAADRHPRHPERARPDRDARRRVGAQHRRRAAGPAQPRRRSRAARIASGRSPAGSTRTRSRPSAPRRRPSGRRRRHHARTRLCRRSTSRWPRTSRLGERRRIQFRSEVFNAFNHANFGPPNIARESSGFGQILTAAPARIIQFGLKFYF